jgi:3',5'-cyclic AMP phosphodiesterase CpdA
MIKIAHISDLHLWKFSFNFCHFFCKRWLGNLNFLFFRKKKFSPNQIMVLPDLLEKLKVDYLIVTGDISSTSLEKEFEEGKKFFDELKKKGIEPICIPGNHDCYTKQSQKDKLFYRYFENKGGQSLIEKKFSLKEDRIEAKWLTKGWWYVGMDSTLATNWFSSRGLFSIETEKKLEELLDLIPKDSFIILACHFPFKMTKSPRRVLKRAINLRQLLKKHSNVKIFLHGHTHHHSIYDLRKERLPLVLDSGSTTHNAIGKWNLIEINGSFCKITIFDWLKKNKMWKESRQKIYNFLEK